jgi:2-C-methyl-D-erythritol 2,4-cyclodiphosphate synthase
LDVRIGIGYDLHRLAAGRPLVLGGVRIPHDRGLAGHSDGDALIHALIDALLGAAGEGDIGRFFPDTDPRYRGADSKDLLRTIVSRLKTKGLAVGHADCVVVAEAPKLAPHIEAVKAALAPILGLRPDRLGVKAKTNEGTGTIGAGEAIACWAVAVLKPIRRKSSAPKRRKRS